MRVVTPANGASGADGRVAGRLRDADGIQAGTVMCPLARETAIGTGAPLSGRVAGRRPGPTTAGDGMTVPA